MPSRRTFLASAAAFAFAPSLRAADPPKKRLAVVTTVWNYHSHAWHMAERFLVGYPDRVRSNTPQLHVDSSYGYQQ